MIDPSWIMLASNVAGALKPAAAAPSTAVATGTQTVTTPWNADGWIVTTGSSTADVRQGIGDKAASAKSEAAASPSMGYYDQGPGVGVDPISAALGGVVNTAGGNSAVVIAAVVLVAVLLMRKKKQ